MILGPRSRTGLIAYPVGPPKLNPIPSTNNATGKASSAPRLLEGEAINSMQSTNTNVPRNSVRKLWPELLIAGLVEKTAKIVSAIFGSFKMLQVSKPHNNTSCHSAQQLTC